MPEPLRLGTSTSPFGRCLPEDFLKLGTSEQDSDKLRDMAKTFADQIAASQVRSLEYFVGLSALDLGLDHPIAQILRTFSPPFSGEGPGERCEVWSVHAPFGGVDLASPDEPTRQKSIEDVKRAAHLASALGAKVLTVHPALELPDMEHLRSVRIELSGHSMAEVADACTADGITVAVEILPRKCLGNSLDELFTILDIADRPNIGVCLDTNHSFPAAALPDVVRRVGPRLVTLHVSDHDDVDERHWLPMRGVIDWPRFIHALNEIGYTGPFLYEAGLGDSDFATALSALEDNYRQLMALETERKP